VTMPDGSAAYTRDGQFKLTRDGNIVTNTGAQLMGYPTDTAGTATSVTLRPMVLPTGAPIPAKATEFVTAEFNLDARAKVAYHTNPPTPITTYGTSLVTFDAQGVEVPLSFYFVKTSPDEWQVFTADQLADATLALEQNAQIYEEYQDWLNDPANAAAVAAADTDTDGVTTIDEYFAAGIGSTAFVPYVAATTMQFSVEGRLTSPTSNLTLTLTSPNPNIGNFDVQVDFSSVTQFGTKFAVTQLTQDGYTAGDLTGMTIDPSGVIMARYSNGQTQAQGQIALADFRNAQGLGLISGGNWVESFSSGQPLFGAPGAGKFGALQSGALEASNVDITAELVNMITAQRTYQANAQTIKTMDQVQQTLVNLR
jgi:flagellar hook protein FlgE